MAGGLVYVHAMTLNEPAAQAGNPAAPLSEAQLLARVLHRDAMMLVIDKPAGMAVHRGPENAASRNARARGAPAEPALDSYFPLLRFGLPRAPELAHRLDRDTSGCLILGRHRQALARLAELFKAGAVEKEYWAVVEGAPAEEEGLIDAPLARLDPGRGWWMKVDAAGQPAKTLWRVMGRSADRRLTWLALTPLTGRTHQLRVHCQFMGWPILGDPVYGAGPRFGGPGLHLHARSVTVPLRPKAPPVHVVADPPDAMRAALTLCGWPRPQLAI
jgi:tRNA pseudouridine32 synthase/23S rRNA pseudouridine746 synthase